ncbi:hypothetical protein ACVW0I_000567 [Bradyrhizobium sp. LM6.11]
MMILSGDPPRSRVLTLVLVLIILALVATPFLFPGAKALNVAAKICVFAALVASYDLLLGYTGSVSFAHTMFYGIGSYAIAIALYGMGPNWAAVATGIVVGLPLAALLALAIGLFSLRVAAIFFAMITLAVASAFQVLASQLSWLTGGEDGRSFQLPELLRPGTVLISRNVLGFEVNGRILTYYLLFAVSAVMILALLRVVNSPFGRVLQAIRENRFPRRSARLPHRLPPDLRQLPRRTGGRRRRHPQCTVAALCRPRYLAQLLDHAGHPPDGGDRRHGHDLRRDHRRHHFHPCPELSAVADGRRFQGGVGSRPAAAAGAVASRPLAAVAWAALHRQRLLFSDRRGRAAAQWRWRQER